ncbi:hypothetical protein DIU36_08085 [Mucilaginibacter rubeus]|nr:hypothetical protein DIU36_08085 [Mucilaginibacter rubeus]
MLKMNAKARLYTRQMTGVFATNEYSLSRLKFRLKPARFTKYPLVKTNGNESKTDIKYHYNFIAVTFK